MLLNHDWSKFPPNKLKVIRLQSSTTIFNVETKEQLRFNGIKLLWARIKSLSLNYYEMIVRLLYMPLYILLGKSHRYSMVSSHILLWFKPVLPRKIYIEIKLPSCIAFIEEPNKDSFIWNMSNTVFMIKASCSPK